ncbi:hypothetical protein CANARDRAFT_28135 [[Candida] arabinofermentans NRRL YB-2248]|uniref:ZFAND1-like ubiquitin-like domain-containing protein n=1 Tax=[Candida] arabinofermentans NRRL YB-2248 TaxID=983967 RepID=A0A1E4T2W3_9ASCO|nr:hypothetical protein CANARDRAFT_28135 [[Candida] arabinofermentans NRRL YB-2248]
MDFLPFTCQICQTCFCSEHRIEFIEHDSNEHTIKNSVDDHNKESKLPPSKSVFPNLKEIREDAEIQSKLKNTTLFEDPNNSNNTKTNSIVSKLVNDSITNTTAIKALNKLKQFISNAKSTTNTNSKSATSSFTFNKKKSSSSSSSSSPALRIIQLSKLKQSAIGDSKISESDRIYINIQYISDNPKTNTNTNTNTTSNSNTVTSIYVSKTWPIGRMLDYSCTLLKIKNENNKIINKNEKLSIFRNRRFNELKSKSNSNSCEDDEFIYIPYNGRVIKEIENGDMIYIVKGNQI